MKLSSLELALIARLCKRCEDVEIHSKSDRPFDLEIKGTDRRYCAKPDDVGMKFSAWLPLLAIDRLLDWTVLSVANMTEYPVMARSGDWSAVRDTRDEGIWNIFDEHVLRIANRIRDDLGD